METDIQEGINLEPKPTKLITRTKKKKIEKQIN